MSGFLESFISVSNLGPDYDINPFRLPLVGISRWAEVKSLSSVFSKRQLNRVVACRFGRFKVGQGVKDVWVENSCMVSFLCTM